MNPLSFSRHILLTFSILLLFSACGGGGTGSTDSADLSSANAFSSTVYEDDSWFSTLEYLNSIRHEMGMVELQDNELLSIAAKNHSLFLKENFADGIHYGHTEVSGLSHFTGVDPWDRVGYMGYDGFDGENISSGRNSFHAAIDSLMTGVYHRFGLLSLSADEMGGEMSEVNGYKIYVTESGNSKIEALCSQEFGREAGVYYTGVCSDSDKLIPAGPFFEAWDASKAKNPVAILFPYEGQIDVTPVFENHEHPDPLPDITTNTGNPISIVFNDYHVTSVSMVSFRLFDSSGEEITNSRILTQKSDPNHRFNTYEYAFFPLDPLGSGVTYTVEASFIVDGSNWEKRWSFTTASR